MKPLFVSAGCLVAALSTLCAGTLAWFHDSTVIAASTLVSGTLNLQIRQDDPVNPDPWEDGLGLTWVMDGMVPGESRSTNSVTLRNAGTVRADHVEIAFRHTIDEVSNPVEADANPQSTWADMARWFEIVDMVYGRVSLRAACVAVAGWDVNGNGWLDLEDVAGGPIAHDGGPLDNLPPPEAVGGEVAFGMSLRLRAEATDDIQGDALSTIVTFTLNQHRSQ